MNDCRLDATRSVNCPLVSVKCSTCFLKDTTSLVRSWFLKDWLYTFYLNQKSMGRSQPSICFQRRSGRVDCGGFGGRGRQVFTDGQAWLSRNCRRWRRRQHSCRCLGFKKKWTPPKKNLDKIIPSTEIKNLTNI